MADLEKRLLAASPLNPFLEEVYRWHIFFVEHSNAGEEVSIFVDFANSFHPTIKFACEMSSECAVFLDTEVFKGPRLSSLRIRDSQTHFKPTETFQYTHFSSCHPFNTKRGFIKGDALRLLRTNSIKKNFQFINTNETLNKDSVTEAIPRRSFIKSWLKFTLRQSRGSS